MFVDRRRILGVFAVLALVMLRLVIGWHFFREGTKKIEYDQHDVDVRLAESAEGFLKQAKGPLATYYLAQTPDDHGAQELLTVPRENLPPTAEESAAAAKWLAADKKRLADAQAKGELVFVEFAPSAPYSDWANRIRDDWRDMVGRLKRVPAFSDDQVKQADTILENRLQQLADYLATQVDAIAEYRHELWRLQNWNTAPEAHKVPFHDERIATKTAETTSQSKSWINAVRDLDTSLQEDLRNLITKEQQGQALTTSAFAKATADPREGRLHTVNIVTTILVIGVGVCLLLGFLTRLASCVGALFLLGVIASQPPWLYESAPTMPQVIEFTALLVLAGTGAGRWAGLDYFTYALFNRRRAREVVTT